MSRPPALARGHLIFAIFLGTEALALFVVAVLFVATDGTLFEGIQSLGYQTLAWAIILIVLMTFVLPVWAIVQERRVKRERDTSPAATDVRKPPPETRRTSEP